MRRLMMVDIHRLELREGPEPAPPGPAEVTLRVEASGLGRTQLHILAGRTHRTPLPRVLGHEIVGRVAALGDAVTHLPLGARVVVNSLIGCGSCRQCRAGQKSICLRRTYLGMEMDGGWTEAITVPAADVYLVPDGVPVSEAFLLCSALPSAIHAVRRSGVTAGHHVAILGLGSIGTLMVQLARAFEAVSIIGVVSTSREIDRHAAHMAPRASCNAPTTMMT